MTGIVQYRAIRSSVLLVIVCMFVNLMIGCDSVAQYSGDGKLIDNGPTAATDRYVLDLGPVSLKSETTAKFQLVNLPKTNFVIGIEILAGTSALKLDTSSISSVVSISLVGPDGKTIVTKDAKLSDWTWSVQSPGNHAFVYGRGEPGTYFTPNSGARYELIFTVREPDHSATNYTASLVAKSGGWK